MTKIAVYEALARSRRRGAAGLHTRFESGENTMTHIKVTAPDPEHQAFATELRSSLESAVDSLPEHHRVVFTLR